MNTRWRKIAGDWREHRTEIFLLAIVLTLGAAGVIAALNSRVILAREIEQSYARANSPDIMMWLERVDPALLEEVRAQPGVAAVAARRTVFTRIAARDGTWFTTRVAIIPDIGQQEIAALHQHDGREPQQREGIFIEQSGRSLVGKTAGDEIQLRTPAGEVVH